MNECQKSRFVRNVICTLFNIIIDKRIAILDFASRKDTSDMPESVAITLIKDFTQGSARVTIYDSIVESQQIYMDLSELGAVITASLPRKIIEIWSNAYDTPKDADDLDGKA